VSASAPKRSPSRAANNVLCRPCSSGSPMPRSVARQSAPTTSAARTRSAHGTPAAATPPTLPRRAARCRGANSSAINTPSRPQARGRGGSPPPRRAVRRVEHQCRPWRRCFRAGRRRLGRVSRHARMGRAPRVSRRRRPAPASVAHRQRREADHSRVLPRGGSSAGRPRPVRATKLPRDTCARARSLHWLRFNAQVTPFTCTRASFMCSSSSAGPAPPHARSCQVASRRDAAEISSAISRPPHICTNGCFRGTL
jgi:hypothetical protein